MRYLFLLFLCVTLQAKEVTLILVRHGQTAWNAEKRVQGFSDIPLNENGLAQAEKAAEILSSEPITAIYSSDLSRSYCTALATAKKLNLPITVRPALREINAGSCEGMKTEEKVRLYQKQWDELKKKYPNKRDRWNVSPVPGEETITALIERIKCEITCIAENTPDKATIAIFSHGRALQSFIADFEDKELEEIVIPNCCVIKVLYNSENRDHPFSRV